MTWRIGLCGLGAALCSGGSATILHGAEGREGAAWIVPLAIAWGAVALSGAYFCRRIHLRPGAGVAAIFAIALLAAIVRAPLIGTPPLLSDDVYRYLWEGLALSAGRNPFVEAPATVEGLDDRLRSLVNHGHLTTVYPPLALAWFRSLHAMGGTIIAAQVAATIADLGLV